MSRIPESRVVGKLKLEEGIVVPVIVGNVYLQQPNGRGYQAIALLKLSENKASRHGSKVVAVSCQVLMTVPLSRSVVLSPCASVSGPAASIVAAGSQPCFGRHFYALAKAQVNAESASPFLCRWSWKRVACSSGYCFQLQDCK